MTTVAASRVRILRFSTSIMRYWSAGSYSSWIILKDDVLAIYNEKNILYSIAEEIVIISIFYIPYTNRTNYRKNIYL